MNALKRLMGRAWQRMEAEYMEKLLALLDRNPSARLLDIGCDNGDRTLQYAGVVGTRDVSGFEIVEQRRALALERGIRAEAGDLARGLPFPAASFDVVTANQVIEHLANTDLLAREILRVLRPGGYAIVCTENLASWHNIASLLFGWQPFSLGNISDTAASIGNPLALHRGKACVNPASWQHVRVFAYLGLRELFERHGFQIDRIRAAGYYGLPGFAANIDKRHAHMLILKVRKPQIAAPGQPQDPAARSDPRSRSTVEAV